LALVVLLSSLSYVLTRCTRAGKTHHHLSDSPETEEKEAPPQYFAAAGSGVREVKQALMGSQEKAPWKVSTLVLKTLALVMSTSSGLSVGKEGPYIHLSASAANLINNSFTSPLRIPRPKALPIGSAAGLSAAFDAPVSGAVFVMEGLGYVEVRTQGTTLTSLVSD
jgi:chloride channel 3/4/5